MRVIYTVSDDSEVLLEVDIFLVLETGLELTVTLAVSVLILPLVSFAVNVTIMSLVHHNLHLSHQQK